MKRIFPYFVFLTALFATGIAGAQQRPDVTARAKSIAPLIDELTIAVFHVDLARIQPEPLLEKVAGWFPESNSQLKAMVPVLSAPLDKLKAAGATDAYAVVSLAGPLAPDNFLFFVVPLSDRSNEQAIEQVIRQVLSDDTLKVDRLNNALVIGMSDTLTRLRTVVPDERPELAAAFKAVEGTAAQAFLLPPKHARRVIEEIMPDLPEAIGAGPSSILTNGMLWAAAGVEISPKASITGVVQSRDKDSAEKLALKWADVRRMLVDDEELIRKIPHFDRLLDFLKPEVRDSRLAFEIDEDSEAFTALIKAIRSELGH